MGDIMIARYICIFIGVDWQDLKSDKQRAQIGAARVILEKSTMMLLTSSKVGFVHCVFGGGGGGVA